MPAARRIGLVLLAATLLGCDRQPSPQPPPVTQPARQVSFEAPLLESAAAYEDWQRVSDNLNWSPSQCSPGGGPPRLEEAVSAAAPGTPHGRKLYELFARYPLAYREVHFVPPSVGQTIVKEAWHPSDKPGPDDRTVILEHTVDASPDSFDPENISLEDILSRTRWEYVYVGEQAELFIMHRLDPATRGTDNGWIYGVVSPEGDKVLEAGLLENCMGCHQQHESRLFGLATERRHDVDGKVLLEELFESPRDNQGQPPISPAEPGR